MPSFLKPSCPYCNQSVALFGKGWQAQRAATKKICPLCQAPVKVTFAGKTFAAWFIPMIALVVLAFFGNAIEVGAGLFSLAFVIPLLASFQLEKDAF